MVLPPSNRGTPSHHPFLDGIFHSKQTIFGYTHGHGNPHVELHNIQYLWNINYKWAIFYSYVFQDQRIISDRWKSMAVENSPLIVDSTLSNDDFP